MVENASSAGRAAAGVVVLAAMIIGGAYAGSVMLGRGADAPRAWITPDPSPPVTVLPPASVSPSPELPPNPHPEPEPEPQPVVEAPETVSRSVLGAGLPPPLLPGNGPFGTRMTTGEAYVALTFDDGPDPRWTPQVLQLLRQYQVRATFCLVGVAVQAHPDLVRDIAADGHTLCNHSWSHDVGLGSRGEEQIRHDLERTNAAIEAAVPGARVSYYRQPGGAWTPRVVAVAEAVGMRSLHWDVDPQDWRKPGAGAIASTVTSRTQPGAIVLLHDGGGERSGTVNALATILPNLTRRLVLDALPPGAGPVRWHGRDLPLNPGQL